MSVVLFSLGVLFLVLAFWPYTLYPLLLRRLPEEPLCRIDRDGKPMSAALLFCAHNEGEVIDEKIANLRAIRAVMPELRVLAYTDNCSDNTVPALAAAADVVQLVEGKERTGKVAGMRRLVNLASDTEVLIFTDANVMVEPESVPKLLDYFKDPTIGAVGGTLIYVDIENDQASVSAQTSGAYWKLEEHIKAQESRSGSTMGADGSLFARRSAHYPAIPNDLADDLAVSLSVLFDGLRCISAPDVLAFESSVGSSAEEFSRKRRIACGSYSVWRYYSDSILQLSAKDRFKFVSHRLIRWWGGLWLLLAGLFLWLGFASLGLGLITAIPGILLMLMIWLLGRQGVRGFSTVYEILSALVAVNLGVLDSLLGRQYVTWRPSTR